MHPHQMLSLRVIVTAIAFCLIQLSARALEFGLTGNVELRDYSNSNKVDSSAMRQFDVAVKSKKWSINTYNASDTKKTRWNSSGISGGEILHLTYVANRNAVGMVVSNSVPARSYDPVLIYLWLAFVSGPCKETAARGAPNIFDRDLKNEPGHIIVGVCEYGTSSPMFPITVTYVDNGFIMLALPSGNQLVKYQTPYDKGFTKAVLQITGFTNAGSMSLPTGFTYTEMLPLSGGKETNDLRMVRQVVAQITEAKDSCPDSAVTPEIPKSTFLRDERLAKGGNTGDVLNYNLKGRPIPSAKTLPDLRERLAKGQTHAPPRNRVVLALLLLVTIAPVAIILIKLARKRT
jgi:hypothetical protein